MSHLEERSGDLGPGKWADLVVLAQDPFQVDPDQLPEARVELTMVGGRVVYQSGSG
ncbi:MAG: amidohydrolase family protein [Candidatus Dormibacteria bacterium]